MEIIKTNGAVRVIVDVDPDQINPRTDYDHVAHVATVPGSKYIDVDPDAGPLADGWDRVKDLDNGVELFTRWARIFHGAHVMEHAPYQGANSVWYLMPDDFKEVSGDSSKFTDEEIRDAFILSEIGEYQAWAEGEVYGWKIQVQQKWQHVNDGNPENDDTMTTWEDIEDQSDCGLYGYEYAAKQAGDAFDAFTRDKK